MRTLSSKIKEYLIFLSELNPLTNVYGVARSVLALSTMLSLLCNNAFLIFKPIAGVEEVPICVNEASASFFCIITKIMPLESTIIIALIILTLVIIGIYPRYTGILHYWIAFSYTGSATVVDGGDQVITVLTFLLVPICLLDNRRWVWSKQKINEFTLGSRLKNLFIWSNFYIIKLQVAIIYLVASIEKLKVPEWSNGTAVYYFFNSGIFGMSDFIKPLLNPLINSPFFVVLITYGTLLLEFLLFTSIFMNQQKKYALFVLAICFHFMIIIVHGLPTFFLAMLGAAILFLIPKEKHLYSKKFILIKLSPFKNIPKIMAVRLKTRELR